MLFDKDGIRNAFTAVQWHRRLQDEIEIAGTNMHILEQRIIQALPDCPNCPSFFKKRVGVRFVQDKNQVICWRCGLRTGECFTIEEALIQWEKICGAIRELKKPDEPVEPTQPTSDKQED